MGLLLIFATAGYILSSFFSGQPSLIYSVQVDLSQKGDYSLKLIGHGSPDGSDGNINEDLSKIDTALEIVENIVISVD